MTVLSIRRTRGKTGLWRSNHFSVWKENWNQSFSCCLMFIVLYFLVFAFFMPGRKNSESRQFFLQFCRMFLTKRTTKQKFMNARKERWSSRTCNFIDFRDSCFLLHSFQNKGHNVKCCLWEKEKRAIFEKTIISLVKAILYTFRSSYDFCKFEQQKSFVHLESRITVLLRSRDVKHEN
jgi:hypothetical protein